jgi:putative DNA primase/helicase
MSELAERARGRWAGILPQLGIGPAYLTGKHGPCPMCGGKDRWRFDNKDGRGTWICSSCGAGDGFRLVMLANGIEFKDAARRVEEFVGSAPRSDPSRGRGDEERRESLNRMWRSSSPVQPGDPVSLWLANRIGSAVTVPACLRYHPRCLYNGEPATWHPAMIAMVTGPNGEPVNLHRTYLTRDGQKAPVEQARRVMEGAMPKGSAVRLMPHEGKLGIAEGIETALAASVLYAVPVWAAINSSMLAQWLPPMDVTETVVFSDSDPKYGGQAASFSLAHRLACKGQTVRVELPRSLGQDWNDVLRQRGGWRL